MEYAQLALDKNRSSPFSGAGLFFAWAHKIRQQVLCRPKRGDRKGHYPRGLPEDRRKARKPGSGFHGGLPAGAKHSHSRRSWLRENHRGLASLRIPLAGRTGAAPTDPDALLQPQRCSDLRKRLNALVGKDAHGVLVQPITELRCGSPALCEGHNKANRGKDIDFERVISTP